MKRKSATIIDEAGEFTREQFNQVRELFASGDFPRTLALAESAIEIEALDQMVRRQDLERAHVRHGRELTRELRGALVIAGSRREFREYCARRRIDARALFCVNHPDELRGRRGARVILTGTYNERPELYRAEQELERSGYFSEVLFDEI